VTIPIPNNNHSADDWRLEGARRPGGLTLHFQRYTRWSEEWEHDHCAACWAKFAEFDGPGILHEDYATGPDYLEGERHKWVCKTCFEELASVVGWMSA
jgi:hypothetical protein